MTMISYAQNGEDVILNRLFPEQEGIYIDVGANDPTESSVTKHFYDRGWRGINIEPEPAAYSRMAAGRPRDINLNLGISDREGVLKFYDAVDANGWSTFSPQQANNLRAQGKTIVEREIPVTTLARVFEDHVREPIQFLKIDAESHEIEVIAGCDWARWRPRVVLIEAMSWVHWDATIRAAGYHFALFDGVNRFYVRDEDRHLLPKFATMANFDDDFHPYAYMRVIEHFRRLHEDLQVEHAQLVRSHADLAARLEEATGQAAGSASSRRKLRGSLRLDPIGEAAGHAAGPGSFLRTVGGFLRRHPKAPSGLKRAGRDLG